MRAVPPTPQITEVHQIRLLLVSDLHYDLRQYDWVLQRADLYDGVVIAGDALSVAAVVPIEAQIVAIRTTIAHLAQRTRVFLCSGNHDLDSVNEAGEKTSAWIAGFEGGAVVDGQTTEVDGVLFSVMPWWDGPAARAAIETSLEVAAAQRSGRWVWVYHSPPESRLSWTGSRHFGDSAVRGWIERFEPELVLCGHIHQAPFASGGSWVDRIGRTWLLNPGRQMGKVPASIDVDLERGTAIWTSSMGIEEQVLGPATPALARDQ